MAAPPAAIALIHCASVSPSAIGRLVRTSSIANRTSPVDTRYRAKTAPGGARRPRTRHNSAKIASSAAHS